MGRPKGKKDSRKFAKRGRPDLPKEHLRVKVNTTIPLPLALLIKQRRWKLNELLQDGVSHREECAGLYDKIARLQKVISEMGDAKV